MKFFCSGPTDVMGECWRGLGEKARQYSPYGKGGRAREKSLEKGRRCLQTVGKAKPAAGQEEVQKKAAKG